MPLEYYRPAALIGYTFVPSLMSLKVLVYKSHPDGVIFHNHREMIDKNLLGEDFHIKNTSFYYIMTELFHKRHIYTWQGEKWNDICDKTHSAELIKAQIYPVIAAINIVEEP